MKFNSRDACDAQPAFAHDTWVLLDEASQGVTKAEAIVSLLGVDSDAAECHAHAANVAGDLLKGVQEKLASAQALLRHTSGQPSERSRKRELNRRVPKQA